MTLPWKRVVVWGPGSDQDSLRWPFFAFRDTARKLGVEALAVPDVPDSVSSLGEGVLCIAADVWSKHLGEAVPGTQYVLHNYPGDSALRATVADDAWIALQVYTDDALAYDHEVWGSCRLWHPGGRTLFQPWGSSLLAEEQYEPVFNSQASDAHFVGAVWNDNGLGNAALIPRVEAALSRRRLRFVHHTQISQAARIELMRSSRFAPAFAGDWQVSKNYLPCRVFDAIAMGQIPATNVARFRDIFGDALPMGETVEETIDQVLSLNQKQWVERVRVMQAVVGRSFTYRDSLAAIARAFDA